MADPVLRPNDNNPSVAEAQDLLNRDGAILDADGSFGPGTASAVREFQGFHHLPLTGIVDAATWQALRALPEPSPDIPTRSVAFIGREEVGGRDYYDRVVSRPTWPGGDSGVTIGIGYDLGYQSNFEADWAGFLSAQQIAALRPWVGIKGAPAEPGKATLAAISIPWRAAWTAFIRRTLPQNVTLTRNTFTNSSALPPVCLGVLVSLIYNRGAAMSDSPPGSGNRTEMREIRDAIAAGQFDMVPGFLRSMKRLWAPTSGLVGRREREAVLFEQGLAQERAATRPSG